MKKSSTLLLLFGLSLISFNSKAQIKKEMLWTLENGIRVPWFNGAYIFLTFVEANGRWLENYSNHQKAES